MQNLPVSEATKHFLACGAIGSGKTTAIKLFLQSIASRFRTGNGRPEQLVIFDAKGDIIPFLSGLGFSPDAENFWILNPYDKRGAVWHLGNVAQDPLMARRLAALLIPEEKRSNAPYFSEGARELIYSNILGLNRISGSTWTLRDLLCSLESVERVRRISSHDRGKVLAARVLDDEKHCFGVISTLGTKLGKFEQVAALWHYKSDAPKFNVESFLSKPGVLVLGNDPVLKDSLWPINGILLRALTQEILRRKETRMPDCWFILDEFRAMQNVECIYDLLNQGRSKGASVLLGIQSVEGITDIYGENVANDILSQCAYKTFLRVGGPKTAEWAERFFGKVRRTEPVYTESWNGDKHGYSIQYTVQERSLFAASYFLNLPFPVRGGIYSCVSDLPITGDTLVVRRPFDAVLSWTKPDGTAPALIPELDPLAQVLHPWTPDEERFFCGSENEESESEPKLPARKERTDLDL